ncbi:MAG: Hsp20/alpha crystallin family protein [Deltaproteobacteria bacterium]|nr:MAG: Hsp20/alpha crystallin family protein [Deltaproteobacteria bacterium]
MADQKLQKQEAATPQGAERTRTRRVFLPRTDIVESKDNIYLYADMPGVDEKGIDITLEKNLLTINGFATPTQVEGHTLSYAEYEEGDYQRTFTLSNEIDREGIQATIRNGVLRLTLPKAKEARERKIPVQAG